jgi:hypothetical protein
MAMKSYSRTMDAMALLIIAKPPEGLEPHGARNGSDTKWRLMSQHTPVTAGSMICSVDRTGAYEVLHDSEGSA